MKSSRAPEGVSGENDCLWHAMVGWGSGLVPFAVDRGPTSQPTRFKTYTARYNTHSIFMVPFFSKLRCILKALRSMCGSCPAPFFRHSCRARS